MGNVPADEAHATVKRLGLPLPAVSVVVRRPGGLILFGQRAGSHGHGSWALPGGKIDPGESALEAAARELREEAGLEVVGLRPAPIWSHDDFRDEAGVTFLNAFVVCDWQGGEPRRVEPRKCLGWRWVTRDTLPGPLFPALHQSIDAVFALEA